MASSREAFEDWLPFLEWQEDREAVDTAQIAERSFVIQIGNGFAGESAGGPRDPGYSEPLMRRPPPPNVPDDWDVTPTYDLDW